MRGKRTFAKGELLHKSNFMKITTPIFEENHQKIKIQISSSNLMGQNFGCWLLAAPGDWTGAKRSASVSGSWGYQKYSSIFFHHGDIDVFWRIPLEIHLMGPFQGFSRWNREENVAIGFRGEGLVLWLPKSGFLQTATCMGWFSPSPGPQREKIGFVPFFTFVDEFAPGSHHPQLNMFHL